MLDLLIPSSCGKMPQKDEALTPEEDRNCMVDNYLYYGDNLDILRRYVDDETVDLVYLDPPFNSNKDYNVLFAEKDGSRSTAQMKAFGDTWKWNSEAVRAYEEIVETGGQISRTMQAFRQLLGANDMLAYLSMMAPRLVELYRVLKPTGSIYLHCDPTASHYLKLLMDAVFGGKLFCNEIIWHYRKWPSGTYTFQRNHDTILFYARTATRDRVFNQLFMERAPSTLKRFGTSKIVSGHDEAGRRVPSKTEEGDSEGVRQDDVWEISRIAPVHQLFPTQKPDALLERIIKASSNEGDMVLDPFCGCGTTIMMAQHLHRHWTGIDITTVATNLIKTRLLSTYGEAITKTYAVKCEPTTYSEAKALAEQDEVDHRYQFQWWALGLVGARRTEEKKGADQGIDGRLYFHDEREGGQTKQVIFSVKSGRNISAKDIRDLRGVIDREQAAIGVLLTMQEPTQPMVKEVMSAGFYQSPWGKHHRLQILTIEELLAGKRVDMPPLKQVNITFKKAPKAKGEQPEELTLPM